MSEHYWRSVRGPLLALVLAIIFVACTGGLHDPAAPGF